MLINGFLTNLTKKTKREDAWQSWLKQKHLLIDNVHWQNKSVFCCYKTIKEIAVLQQNKVKEKENNILIYQAEFKGRKEMHL